MLAEATADRHAAAKTVEYRSWSRVIAWVISK
jgi:hypothetical protein